MNILREKKKDEKTVLEDTKEYLWKLKYITGLHSKWLKAVSLHRSKKLKLVQSIEYGYTEESLTKKGDEISGSIYFFCYPMENEEAALECGRNLLEQMGDSDNIRSIKFKTEQETNLAMTTSKHKEKFDASVER